MLRHHLAHELRWIRPIKFSERQSQEHTQVWSSQDEAPASHTRADGSRQTRSPSSDEEHRLSGERLVSDSQLVAALDAKLQVGVQNRTFTHTRILTHACTDARMRARSRTHVHNRTPIHAHMHARIFMHACMHARTDKRDGRT